MECRVSLVVEMFVRMLHHCGMPMDDVDLIHGNGAVVGEILKTAKVRSTLFTGSAKVAEILAKELQGKVCLFGVNTGTIQCCDSLLLFVYFYVFLYFTIIILLF